MSNLHESKKKELMDQRAAKIRESDSLSTRRTALQSDQTKARAEVDRLQDVINDALIAGADVTKEHDQLQREKSKLGSFEMAIVKIDKQIEILKIEAAEKEKLFRMMDFYAQHDVMQAHLLETIDALRIALGKFALAKAASIEASKTGFDLNHHDETSATMRVYQQLEQNLMIGSGSISATLLNLETNYRDFFTQARKQ